MSKMSEMDTVISDLRSAAETITGVADALFCMCCGTEEPEALVEPPKPVLTLPEVRAVLADKSRAGFTAQIKELLRKHGAEKLSGIDPAEYEGLLADVEVLGNG